MGLPATYLRVDVLFHKGATGSKAMCTLWYLKAGAGTDPTLATVASYANDFKTAYSAAISGWLPEDCEMYAVKLKWVSGGNEVEGQNTNGAVGGASPGECLPEEDAVVIQRRTGLQGRSKRGRIFLPYVSEDYQEDGELNATGKLKAAGVATMVKGQVTAQTVVYDPYTLDRKNGVLVKVVQAGYQNGICSRRDRRFPRGSSGVTRV